MIKEEKRKYKLTFTNRILGSAPKNKEIYSEYIASKTENTNNAEDELSMIEDSTDGRKITGFHTDVDGVYLLDYQIKGNLKENANILKDALVKKNLRAKIGNFVHIEPRHFWLADKPAGILERPLRAQTAQGPRTSLAASEYVEAGVSIEVTIILIPNKEVTWEVIEDLLNHGKRNGISQWRSAYYGTFDFERIE